MLISKLYIHEGIRDYKKKETVTEYKNCMLTEQTTAGIKYFLLGIVSTIVPDMTARISITQRKILFFLLVK